MLYSSGSLDPSLTQCHCTDTLHGELGMAHSQMDFTYRALSRGESVINQRTGATTGDRVKFYPYKKGGRSSSSHAEGGHRLFSGSINVRPLTFQSC